MPPAIDAARFGARQAQPLDTLMADAKDVLAGLFAKPDPKDLPPMAAAAVAEAERVKGIAARLFAPGSEGEALLEHLCDAMLRRPAFVTQLGVDPMQALMYGAFREGQAAAIFYLLALIAEGRSEQPPQREGNFHGRSSTRSRQQPVAAEQSKPRRK